MALAGLVMRVRRLARGMFGPGQSDESGRPISNVDGMATGIDTVPVNWLWFYDEGRPRKS